MSEIRTIVVTVPGMIAAADLAPLRELSEVEYCEVDHITEADLSARCSGFEYLMLNYDAVKKLSPDFYRHKEVQGLRAISADITGMDWASPEAAAANGVCLTNIPHYSTESVAETILAEILLHSRQRHLAYVDEIKGRVPKARKGINLVGRTAGIVGLGSIGTRAAEMLAAIGMVVVAWNRSPQTAYRSVALDELFETSQVICICLKTVREGPDRNVGLIGQDLLARCRGAIVINLANVDLVDHDALPSLIVDEHVRGYTVERNAQLLSSPIAEIEQVHLPPSNSWFSDESLQMLRHVWVRNVMSAIEGDFPNRVAV